MDCLTARERMVPWLDGELARGEAEQLETHVGGCERCVAQAERLSEQQAQLKALGPASTAVPAPNWSAMDARLAAELDAVEAAVEAPRPPPLWKREQRLPIGAVVAYAALLLLSLLFAADRHLAAAEAEARATDLTLALQDQALLDAIGPAAPQQPLNTVGYHSRGSF